jgi:hypothetical protein
MDVVIPLGSGSRWKDNELRYALRSIEKHLKGYDKVFIVGNCPKWINLEKTLTETNCGLLIGYPEKPIIHIPCPDIPGRKEFSIFSKIMKAVEDERCSEDFVFSNDDIFFLKDIHVNDFKYWYEGTLGEKYEKTHGHYKGAIFNTMNLLYDKGDEKYCDIHTPIVYRKYGIRAISIPDFFDWSKENVIKSLYSGHFGADFEPMPDLKINMAMSYELIKAKIKDRLFLSIGTYGVCPAMTKVLTELFPNKSKYEI